MEFIPTKQDELRFNKIISGFLKKIKVKHAISVLGGSGAKGTWLKDTHDIDIYVKFNYNKYKDKSNELSKILEKAIKNLKPIKLHGSRDYFQVNYKNLTFEIIPILDIKKSEQAKNITDLSILHTNYVKKYKKLANDVRKAKAFTKACGCYGAESYIKGFSGYVLEVLVIHYKSFKNLIKNVANWQSKEIIGNKKLAEELNYAKKQSPLILIDPTQQERNAAASLSQEKFNVFKKTAKAYLKNPSDRFFIKQEQKIPKQAIILEATPLKGKQDIVGSKLLKSFEFIKTNLQKQGFKIEKSNWQWQDKAKFWFVINNTLPKTKKHYGPPIKIEKHAKQFKKKYKNTKIEKNRLYTIIKVKYRKPKEFIKSIIKDPYVKERVKNIK